MKETLKGILKNTIDEKKYIFKYPIISYRYYDQAKFLHISDEEIGKEYNVDEDIARYNEEDSKGYSKRKERNVFRTKKDKKICKRKEY